MKTTLFALILAVLLLCSLGCASKAQKTQSKAGTATAVQNTVDNHSSRDSLDWYGTYNGVVPCADCQGIKTRITLLKDNTFTKAVKYLGKDSRSRLYQGTIQWDAAQFVKAVLKADNYTVADGTFSLNKARMAPLAKFKKAQEKL